MFGWWKARMENCVKFYVFLYTQYLTKTETTEFCAGAPEVSEDFVVGKTKLQLGPFILSYSQLLYRKVARLLLPLSGQDSKWKGQIGLELLILEYKRRNPWRLLTYARKMTQLCISLALGLCPHDRHYLCGNDVLFRHVYYIMQTTALFTLFPIVQIL